MQKEELTKISVMFENIDLYDGYEITNIELCKDDSINFTLKKEGGIDNYRINSDDIETEFIDSYGTF